MSNLKLTGCTLALAVMVGAFPAVAQDKPQLAFVVNAASDFWKLAEAGVAAAQKELSGYDLQFRYPAQGTAALQNALMDDLVAAGTDAIMISSVDPKNSTEAFNRIASQIPLFTTDSDAPQSNRIAYIGSSNTLAGEQAGEEMVKLCLAAENAWASWASSTPTMRASGSTVSVPRSRGTISNSSTSGATTWTLPAPVQTSMTCWPQIPRSPAWWASIPTTLQDLRGVAGCGEARPDHGGRF